MKVNKVPCRVLCHYYFISVAIRYSKDFEKRLLQPYNTHEKVYFRSWTADNFFFYLLSTVGNNMVLISLNYSSYYEYLDDSTLSLIVFVMRKTA